MDDLVTGHELRSLVTSDGKLRLSMEPVSLTPPGAGELLVRVEAAPINPSDLGTLLGPCDPATLRSDGAALVADVPRDRLAAIALRLDKALPVGNEGAGTILRAGPGLEHLAGRTIAMVGPGMYATARKIPVGQTMLLPEGTPAAEGASLFVNPRTALGFVETARAEGHKAIIHSAAASNLGRMLLRICLADGMPLVNIVRSAAQETLLRDMGATYVVDSSRPDFRDRLIAAIEETGATIAFDAVGGGRLASQILDAMEAAFSKGMEAYNRYGSGVMKQVYIYGTLDPGPTLIDRIGYAWKVDGWLVGQFLARADAATVARINERVVAERSSTFASQYSAAIGLAEALNPDVARDYERKGTGAKYLIDPRL